MKTTKMMISVAVILGMLSACGSSGPIVDEVAREETASLRATIDRMQSDLKSVKDQALAPAQDAASQDLVSAMGKELDALQDDLRRVQSAIRSLEEKVAVIEQEAPLVNAANKQILDDIQLIKSQIKQLNNKLTQTDAAPAAEPSAPPAPAAAGKKRNATEYRNDYINSLSDFQNGRYEDARKVFVDLIESNPEHSLADNAQYWIGETYYAQGNYQRAIIEFEKVFTFTDKGKWDDSQFKLGLCYRKLGDDEKAADELQRLIKYYPYSEYINQANVILKNIGK
ncbi:MAG TPA: tetratricopeptide repeat protein [Candidatus Marinimicrobia bacterium]|nr:tetratricopeptide repeat protein [Candidatus Neomarinimicrobiota bacterium]